MLLQTRETTGIPHGWKMMILLLCIWFNNNWRRLLMVIEI